MGGGGTGGRRIPRDGRGEGKGEGGKYRDCRGANSGKGGVSRGATAVIYTTATEASGRRRKIENLPAGAQDDSAGGKYRKEGSDTEESATESA